MLVLFVAISLIGVRFLSYWWSFLVHWKRYRKLNFVSTYELREIEDSIPNIKIQITTRGSYGSTEVIMRGIRSVERLVKNDPAFYGNILTVEIVTESTEQAKLVEHAFTGSDLQVDVVVIPTDYETPQGTKLKARGLHYIVEQRRLGWNKRPGRTFIVHYDEESVMVAGELRKLIACLATTDKKILEGPIYYPLEYMDASPICRAMEANRPVGCFECRHVMESGVPLHLHGSNLVIDEALENEIGWDIGCLDGQPFIAEDYVFGMNAFVAYGQEVFGWHGCVMLEQPPFSFKSTFKQRHRWIFGVLQGMAMVQRYPSFNSLPRRIRLGILWGTRYRIATFALGAIVGVLSFLMLPFLLVRALKAFVLGTPAPLAWGASLWLASVGIMWLGSVFIGAWYNIADAGLNRWQQAREIARAITVAPIAGILESSAGFWAVFEWSIGRRDVFWKPTPKTKLADADKKLTVETV
jgi:hypothetical protein